MVAAKSNFGQSGIQGCLTFKIFYGKLRLTSDFQSNIILFHCILKTYSCKMPKTANINVSQLS